MHHVTKNDAMTYLANTASRSIDLILTDPAYESLEKHRAVGTTTRLTGKWFQTIPNAIFPQLALELYRVLKDDRHCYIMCDQETMWALVPAMQSVGFRFWKPIVWDKVAIGMGYHYRARYEFILFFEKGKRKLKDLGMPDVLVYKRIRGGYPTEKPVDLLMALISQSTDYKELVLDPFMGSGATMEAAYRLGRHCSGCDIAEDAIDYCNRRMRGLERRTNSVTVLEHNK